LSGRSLPVHAPEDIEEGFQAAASVAQQELLSLMMESPVDKIRLLASKEWLRQSGHGAIQKVAVMKRVSVTTEDISHIAQVIAEEEGHE